MPDFDTRTPQEERNRGFRDRIALIARKVSRLLSAIKPRIRLIANRLRSLLMVSKLRILSMANALRRLLVASRVRTLLIGGWILLLAKVELVKKFSELPLFGVLGNSPNSFVNGP
jgi:hypothetical protein